MRTSPQTRLVVRALAVEPDRWRHGYELLRLTGLKSGSLYPILVRLEERGLLEATWENDAPTGRPRRHLYRLTAEGARSARGLQADPPTQIGRLAEGTG
jgi:DNA-binding PadR family transcriptional regulator